MNDRHACRACVYGRRRPRRRGVVHLLPSSVGQYWTEGVTLDTSVEGTTPKQIRLGNGQASGKETRHESEIFIAHLLQRFDDPHATLLVSLPAESTPNASFRSFQTWIIGLPDDEELSTLDGRQQVRATVREDSRQHSTIDPSKELGLSTPMRMQRSMYW